jgi:hypothetical protein
MRKQKNAVNVLLTVVIGISLLTYALPVGILLVCLLLIIKGK